MHFRPGRGVKILEDLIINSFEAAVIFCQLTSKLLRLLVFLVQGASDEHSADFAGSSTNLVELRIAHDSASRVIIDVPVAAEDLDRIEADLSCLLGAVEDDTSAVLGIGFAQVTGTGDVVQIAPAGVEGRVHVCHLPLQQLELSDSLVELLSRVRVLKRDIAGCLHESYKKWKLLHVFVQKKKKCETGFCE